MNQLFDPETFIRHTTDQVWNRKNVGEFYHCAVSNVAVHGPSGREGYGREALMSDVIAWLAAFPDTQVEIEDVIWDGDEESGFQISVRRTLAGQNSGTSIYGPPTGAEVSVRSLVIYTVYDGMIREIWHEFDEVGLIRQLGFDLFETIKRVEQQQPAVGPVTDVVGEIERTTGQLPPAVLPTSPSGFDPAELVHRALQEIWNWRMVGHVKAHYADRFVAHGSGKQLAGPDELAAAVLATLAAFPDLSFSPDQIIAAGDGRSGYRVATRWTLLGTHLGSGEFGPPTGKRVRLNGISQHRIWRGQFHEEWTELGSVRTAEGDCRETGQRRSNRDPPP